MADKWYTDSTVVASFGTVLINAGILEDQDDFKLYLAKPFKYNEIYTAWEQADFPDENDDDWDEFVEAISSDDESDDETEDAAE